MRAEECTVRTLSQGETEEAGRAKAGHPTQAAGQGHGQPSQAGRPKTHQHPLSAAPRDSRPTALRCSLLIQKIRSTQTSLLLRFIGTHGKTWQRLQQAIPSTIVLRQPQTSRPQALYGPTPSSLSAKRYVELASPQLSRPAMRSSRPRA